MAFYRFKSFFSCYFTFCITRVEITLLVIHYAILSLTKCERMNWF